MGRVDDGKSCKLRAAAPIRAADGQPFRTSLRIAAGVATLSFVSAGGTRRQPFVLVQIAVLVILGSLGGKFERQTFVCDLVDPDPRRHRDRSLISAPLITGFCRRGRLSAELPT